MVSKAISALVKELPDLCRTADLVRMGLYPTEDAAYLARTRGLSPDYIKVGRKVLFPKQCVIEFLSCRLKSVANE